MLRNVHVWELRTVQDVEQMYPMALEVPYSVVIVENG
jgi:hypothetical protein